MRGIWVCFLLYLVLGCSNYLHQPLLPTGSLINYQTASDEDLKTYLMNESILKGASNQEAKQQLENEMRNNPNYLKKWREYGLNKIIEERKLAEEREKSMADAKVADAEKQKEIDGLNKRIQAYKQLKSPSQSEQMQQLVDLQQLQVYKQEESIKQAENNKKRAEFDKSTDDFQKTVDKIMNGSNLDNSLDRALRKDHLNRRLGIY